jgi:hypothetical protein
VTIYEHIKKFAGRPVRKVKARMETPTDPAGTAWRVTTDYDGGSEKFDRRFDALVNSAWAARSGHWSSVSGARVTTPTPRSRRSWPRPTNCPT